MKTPPEDHDLLRWLDGEMSAAERERFDARLAADPALKAEADMMQRLSADLRTHLPAEMPVPYGDFFNSQIQRRLTQEEDQAPVRAPASAGWLSWLRLQWLAPVGLAAVVIAAGLTTLKQDGVSVGGSDTYVHSIYVPNTAVHASTYHSADAKATVLMLDGLEEMPADRKIVGFNITRGEVDQDVAATTLFDAEDNAVAVISKDARSQPVLLTSSPAR